jgi:Fe2+ transport system protein B
MKSCHTTREIKVDSSPTLVPETPSLLKKQDSPPKNIALMGNPSAGKSAMFSQMTGVTVVISNIPQTTVMVQKGLSQINGHKVLIYDLPGVYSITAVTEDEAATYAGIPYALSICLISVILIVASGGLLKSVVPGRTAGLVLEIPLIRRPALVPIVKKTWLRMKEFLYIAVPLLIAGSIIFGWLDLTGLSRLVEGPMAPITVGILGLPAFTGICLIYSVLRKEMALEMLAIASEPSYLAPL